MTTLIIDCQQSLAWWRGNGSAANRWHAFQDPPVPPLVWFANTPRQRWKANPQQCPAVRIICNVNECTTTPFNHHPFSPSLRHSRTNS